MRLFNRYYSIYDLILVIGDVTFAFLAITTVRFALILADASAIPQWTHWSFQSFAVTITVVFSFYYCDLYAIDQTLSIREMLLRLLTAVGLSSILIAAVSYPIPQLGKFLFVTEMTLIAIGLCAWRIALMRLIKNAQIHSRVLIIGVQSIGKLVAEELLKQKKLRMEVVGFVGDATNRLTLSYGNPVRVSLPVFAPQSMIALHGEQKVSRILLASGEACSETVAQELLVLRARGVPVEDCHSFYERLVSKIAVADLSPEWLMRSKGFRRSRIVMFTKRTIDLLVSFLGLLVSAPLLLLTAAAIKLESCGSVCYRQQRVGQNDQTFTIYKFRSMSANAESDGRAVWASKNDPRITRVGKIIRQLRIDEIPQMFNVLKGDMSFVGPRPERPCFVEALNKKVPYYSLRHSVKPGITGWAQISYPYGDSEQGAVEKLQYDLYYIKNMSALFDLQIIFETLKVILLGKGAH